MTPTNLSDQAGLSGSSAIVCEHEDEKTAIIRSDPKLKPEVLLSDEFDPVPRKACVLGIGHFEVLETIGRGGFGVVVKAFDHKLQRLVAIKMMPAELAATSPARKRFVREARAGAAVRDENVVRIYDVGEQPVPCFAFGGPMLTLEQAVALIQGRVAPVDGEETIAIAEADGRVLMRDIASPIDLPPFDNSAVDGYAVRHADLGAEGGRLPVRGRLAAGDAPAPLSPGTAMRIFTGAPMPRGADTVFMQEDVTQEGEIVRLPAGLACGANARSAGEDVRAGARLLPARRVLRPQDLALASAAGLRTIAVRRRIRVALFSTGDELAAEGALAPGAIHDANRPLLAAMLRRMGCETSDLGVLRDRPESLAAALSAAASSHDLILTTGGVSAGEEDHVKTAVERLGSLVFWRIGVKPGRPVALGVIRGAAFAGLPGNPVAAFVTFAFVVRPLLAQLAGAEAPRLLPLIARSGFTHRKKKDRREYLRVVVSQGEGAYVARKFPQDGAGVIASLTETDGLAELPEAVTRVEPGDEIAVYPYALLL